MILCLALTGMVSVTNAEEMKYSKFTKQLSEVVDNWIAQHHNDGTTVLIFDSNDVSLKEVCDINQLDNQVTITTVTRGYSNEKLNCN